MAVTFLQKSSGNSATTTLSSAVTNTDTSFPLTSDTAFLSGGGLVIIDEGQAAEELAYYTGKSGGALTIPLANRGLEGGSAQGHDSGASVKGVLSADMWNNLIETVLNGFSATDGSLDTSKVLPASYLDTDGTLAANSDSKIATQKATKTYSMPLSYLDTDGTLAANSDTKIPSQKAIKTYVTANSGATDGWSSATGTWTYASASTITVPSGAASIYQRGDKIKWTQTTVRYGVILTVADTLLTIAVNNDYVVDNAAITAPYYSHTDTPMGFPSSFNYTPTYTFTAGADPTGSVSSANAEYSVNGGVVTVRSSKIYGTAGTTVTRCDISLPFTVNSSVDQTVVGGGCFSNGTAPITTYNQITTTTVQMFCASSTTDRMGFLVSLEI